MSVPVTGGQQQAPAGIDAVRLPPIRVVMAEDSYLIREFLIAVLGREPEIELAAVCADARELDRAIDIWHPHVVVTDIRMPPTGGDAGIRVATRLLDRDPAVGVVVLSADGEPVHALALLGRHARRRAYLLKERIRDRRALIGAIEAVWGGGSVVDPVIVRALIDARARPVHSPLRELSGPERAVLAGIASGEGDPAIARELDLPVETVAAHGAAAFAKLGLAGAQDAAGRLWVALAFLADADPARGVL